MARSTPWDDEYTLLCERCGYVIEGLPTDGDCPECGKPISESLPERRIGTPWQRKSTKFGYAATLVRTARAPLATLDELRIDPESARRLLRRHLWMAALLFAPLLSLTLLLVLETPTPLPGGGEVVWTPGSPGDSIGLIVFLCLVMAPVAYGSLGTLTLIERRGLMFFGRHRQLRMTRALSATICAHGAAAWLIAGIGGMLIFYALLPMEEEMGRQPARAGWLIAGSSIALVGFLWFEAFAYLGMRRCKYANRTRPIAHAQGSLAEDVASEKEPGV